MLPLQYAREWRFLSIALVLLVLAATLMPAVWLFDNKVGALVWFRHADKWLHGLTFLALTRWFAGLYRKNDYWRIAVGLLAFGFLIELCQLAVSYRTAEWVDIMANAAGIIAGLLVAVAGAGGWCQRVEDWNAARNPGT